MASYRPCNHGGDRWQRPGATVGAVSTADTEAAPVACGCRVPPEPEQRVEGQHVAWLGVTGVQPSLWTPLCSSLKQE